MSKKLLMSLILGVFVTVLSACGGVEDSVENNNEALETIGEEIAQDSESIPETTEAQEGIFEQPEMPEPDLEGIPDVVAEVNGVKIAKDEFEATYGAQFMQAVMQAQMFGEEVDQDNLKGQILEVMIGQELLRQEANRVGLNASEEEVNESINELVAQNGLASKEEFMAALEQQGMSEVEVVSQLEIQIEVEKLIASEVGDIDPSNEELEETYNQMVAQQEQMAGEEGVEIPAFDEIKNELRDHVKNQKESEAVLGLVEKLRADADIITNL